MPNEKRGLASASEATRKRVARAGGKAQHSSRGMQSSSQGSRKSGSRGSGRSSSSGSK